MSTKPQASKPDTPLELQSLQDLIGGMTLHEAARYYASERRWPVFPCKSDKTPATENGVLDATIDLDQIDKWWTENPGANIGLDVAGAGYMVVDYDPGSDKAALEEKLGVKLDTPFVAHTPRGGTHEFYKLEMNEMVPASASRLGKSIDVRSFHSYVLVAPSKTSAGSYIWSYGATVAGTGHWRPQALFDEAGAAREKSGDHDNWIIEQDLPENRERAIDWLKNKARLSYQGEGGDNNAYATAAMMKSFGLSEETALESMWGDNWNNRCEPPWEHEELEVKVANGYSYNTSPPGNMTPAYKTAKLVGLFTGIDAGEVAGDPVIRELNTRHAVLALEGRMRVMNDYDPDNLTFSGLADFNMRYANQTAVVPGKDGPKQIALATFWMKHPERRQYETLTFDPSGKAPANIYNTWRGFAFTPKAGDCSMFLDHVRKVIANGDTKINKYILDWLADACQNPATKPGTALVLRGAEGTGKTFFAERFGKLFGRHFLSVSDSARVTGQFNSVLADKLVLLADEAFFVASSDGVLKSLITSDEIQIERKGIETSTTRNYLRLIMASNNAWVIPAGATARRFLVLDISDTRREDHTYFAAFAKQMDNGGSAALLHYLLARDLTGVNLRTVPRTKALLDQQLNSQDPFEQWIYDKLRGGSILREIPWEEPAPAEEVFVDYRAQAPTNKPGRPPLQSNTFGERLKEVLGSRRDIRTRTRQGDKRPYFYTLPPLADCRKAFEDKLLQKISWPAVVVDAPDDEPTPRRGRQRRAG